MKGKVDYSPPHLCLESVEKRERGPSKACEQFSLRPRARQNPNADQNAEQQSREILRYAIGRYGSLRLRRFNRSAEKRLKIVNAVVNDGAEFLVVRRDFERRVD